MSSPKGDLTEQAKVESFVIKVIKDFGKPHTFGER